MTRKAYDGGWVDVEEGELEGGSEGGSLHVTWGLYDGGAPSRGEGPPAMCISGRAFLFQHRKSLSWEGARVK